MSSPKQIEANRRNALKSTGPVTAAGKAISSRNAVAPIGAAMRLHLIEAFHARFAPVSLEERAFVNTMAHAEWRQSILNRVESAIWKFHEIAAGTPDENSLAAVYRRASRDLDRVGRAMDHTSKLFDSSYSALMKHRAASIKQTLKPAATHSGLFCVPKPTGC